MKLGAKGTPSAMAPGGISSAVGMSGVPRAVVKGEWWTWETVLFAIDADWRE